MTIETTSRVVRVAGMQTTNVDNDVVILNMKTNNYVALDEIGRRVWEALATPVLVSDLCENLRREFSAPAEKIETDVVAFINELQAEGLASVVE